LAPSPSGGEFVRLAAQRAYDMARPTTVFVCNAGGAESAKRRGQCPGCGAWNALSEDARAANGRAPAAAAAAKPVVLANVRAPRHARLHTGIGELDRIPGGGLVPGSLVLIGGSPGIDKSTLTSMGSTV
jgi:DNA repair protein RadA/Sms